MFKLFILLSNIYIFNCVKFGTTIDNGPKFGEFKTVLDANWRYLRTEDYKNCYDGKWLCGQDCNKCLLEGVKLEDYDNIYGIKQENNILTLQFVKNNNIGSRLYLLKDNKYWMPNLLNKELSIEVDLSEIPCGMNAAIYFIEMKSTEFDVLGVGYGDAQCPKDIKYLFDSSPNLEVRERCENEIDIIEANAEAMAWTLHPCNDQGCDKSGADANSYRQGFKDFFGRKKKVDTTKKMTVITQFIGDPLHTIRRFYKQDGKLIEHPGGVLDSNTIDNWMKKFKEPNNFEKYGGFKSLTDSIKRGMVLAISIWDDPATKMKWLDSDDRGPCGGKDLDLRNNFKNVKSYIYDVKLSDLQDYKHDLHTFKNIFKSDDTIYQPIPSKPQQPIQPKPQELIQQVPQQPIQPKPQETIITDSCLIDDKKSYCCFAFALECNKCISCYKEARHYKGQWCGESEERCKTCSPTAIWCK